MIDANDGGNYGRPDPMGQARPAGYANGAEYFADLLGVVQARMAAAIHERWELGLLSETGDAAAALFLERKRVEAMLEATTATPGAGTTAARARAERVTSVWRQRTAATVVDDAAVPLVRAFAAWELSEAEQLLLGGVLGGELSPTLARLLSYLGGDATRPGMTVEAAACVLRAGEGGVLQITERLAQDAPLRRLGLLSLRGNVDLPFLRRTVHAAPRLFALARGVVALDERLAGLGAELRRDRPRDLAVRHVRASVRRQLETHCTRSAPSEPIGVVVARRGLGAAAILTDVAAAAGRSTLLFRAAARTLDDDLTASLLREARLHRSMLLILDDTWGESNDRDAALSHLLDGLAAASVPVVLLLERTDPQTPRPVVPLVRTDIPEPDAAERLAMWREALAGDATALDLDGIASAYAVGAETIERSVAGARAIARGEGLPVNLDHIARAFRSQVSSDLSGVASHLRITQKWEDLVVPDDIGDLVLEFIDRARQRRRVLVEWGFARKVGKGLGLIALFSGRPGTGKSMAAGLIARELGLDAYQIDISRILSKWIGETEKALSAAFDAAEAGHALLIFDEADALFGKRISDVKTSTDRYANVETNFILNRLEWFSGIAILTSNLEGNLDPAFRRRISIHAQFPFPDENNRRLLWETIIPDEAPTEGAINHVQLAKDYKLSGGQIRNIALRAAFLASAAGEHLSMTWIKTAAERQYAAQGKLMAGGEMD